MSNGFYTPNGTPYDMSGGGAPDPNRQNQIRGEALAGTSQTMGIIALLLTLICNCLPVGIVLGILAIVKSSASRQMLGYNTSAATVGKICGIIALILTVILAIVSAYTWFFMVREILQNPEAFYQDYPLYP